MTPTDSYYEQLHGHLRKKYPKADPHLLDHLIALEAFLDKSIVFGFSYGLSKAEIAVMQGKLLGHHLSRGGVKADPERSQAVRDFPPLREKLHIQQFLGCGNWLRAYLCCEDPECLSEAGCNLSGRRLGISEYGWVQGCEGHQAVNDGAD